MDEEWMAAAEEADKCRTGRKRREMFLSLSGQRSDSHPELLLSHLSTRLLQTKGNVEKPNLLHLLFLHHTFGHLNLLIDLIFIVSSALNNRPLSLRLRANIKMKL